MPGGTVTDAGRDQRRQPREVLNMLVTVLSDSHLNRVRLRWSDEPSGSSRHRSVGVARPVDPLALSVEVELPVVLEVAVAA